MQARSEDDRQGEGGALAWHADLELSRQELDRFLAGRWVARLATNGADGYPHVTPCYYYWDGHCMYLSLTRHRVPGRNLMRDPRCAVVIDFDQRPLMGMATNSALAVSIVGDVEIVDVAPGETVSVEGGPWKGEQPAQTLLWGLVSRYGLSERDGVGAGSSEEVMAGLAGATGSRALADNEDRIVVKIRPTRIRSWDFSRAPMLS